MDKWLTRIEIASIVTGIVGFLIGVYMQNEIIAANGIGLAVFSSWTYTDN